MRALQFLGWRWGGFYLEVGVYDAVHENNCVLMEREYGWRGVAVDPLVQHIDARHGAVHFGVALASESSEGASFSMHQAYSGLTQFATSPKDNAKWAGMMQGATTTEVCRGESRPLARLVG